MRRLATLAAGCLGLLACGPIQSTAFLMDAEVQLQAAKTAGADKWATYEWTAANLYLHKAKMEVGHSAYESAVEYAGKAKKLANEAREKAVANPAKGAPVSAPTKP